MRNQSSIVRSAYGVIPGLVLVLLLIGVVTDDWQPFLWGLVLIPSACFMGALINIVVFPPLFRLLARLTGRPDASKPDSPNHQA